MENKILLQLQQVKKAALSFGSISEEKRNDILRSLMMILYKQKDEIMQANAQDITYAHEIGKSDAFINRLTLTDDLFDKMIVQIETVISLDSYTGKVIEERIMDKGLVIHKVSVPLGVIGIIYESRPNVTIDAAILCIKSGNAVVLKGGSESIHTNRVLAACIQSALKGNDESEHAVTFIDATDHVYVSYLLKQDALIDVIIPRGGYELVKKVVDESRIPVLYHAEGGARIYIDKSADIDQAVSICVNAKTNRPATCNALDTIVVHKDIAKDFLTKFKQSIDQYNVLLFGDEETQAIIPVEQATSASYATEFLDYRCSIKIVHNLDEAIAFVQMYSKHHSEGIVAKDDQVIAQYTQAIDAAAVFVNCSTRLHDGFVFGLGAEMGIATGKLHARGPVGLKELTTYKWVVYGDGQVR